MGSRLYLAFVHVTILKVAITLWLLLHDSIKMELQDGRFQSLCSGCRRYIME
jgi:hypothetical protein